MFFLPFGFFSWVFHYFHFVFGREEPALSYLSDLLVVGTLT